MAPRVAKHPDVRRDEMMDAALRLCMSVGYDAMSIDQVTQAVGVAKGTFYYHFPSKTALLVAVVERWVDDLFRDLEAQAPHLVGTGAERFRTLMQLGTAWKLENLARLKRSLLKVGACGRDERVLDREVWTPLIRGYERASASHE